MSIDPISRCGNRIVTSSLLIGLLRSRIPSIAPSTRSRRGASRGLSRSRRGASRALHGSRRTDATRMMPGSRRRRPRRFARSRLKALLFGFARSRPRALHFGFGRSRRTGASRAFHGTRRRRSPRRRGTRTGERARAGARPRGRPLAAPRASLFMTALRPAFIGRARATMVVLPALCATGPDPPPTQGVGSSPVERRCSNQARPSRTPDVSPCDLVRTRCDAPTVSQALDQEGPRQSA